MVIVGDNITTRGTVHNETFPMILYAKTILSLLSIQREPETEHNTLHAYMYMTTVAVALKPQLNCFQNGVQSWPPSVTHATRKILH